MPVLGATARGSTNCPFPSRHLGLVTAVEHGEQRPRRGRRDDRAGGPRTSTCRRRRRGGRARDAASRGVPRPPSAAAPPTARHRCARGGQGVQLRLRRTLRTAARRRRRRRRIRPADRPVAAAAPPRWCCPADFPRSSAPNCPPTTVCGDRSHALAAGGAPVHAECAGLTYLVDELDGYPMCGVLAGYGTVHRQADTGLPRRRRGRRLVAVRRRRARRRP